MSLRILMLLENNAYHKDVRVRNEAQSLVANGYNVTVICPRAKADEPAQETIDGVHIRRYPSPPEGDGLVGYVLEYGFSLLTALWLSLRELFSRGFDVIHAHNPPDVYVLLAMMYKLIGKRFVFDHHDLSPELYYYARFDGKGNKLVYRMLVFFENLSCRIADKVIATNQSYKDMQIERAGIPAEKSFIVRNGPNLEKLRVPETLTTTRDANAPITIGYLGIIGFQDGADVLVRAVQHLYHNMGYRNFHCKIAGSGDALDSVKALAHELDVADCITFTGWVNYQDIPEVMSSFDICAAPELSNVYADKSTVIKMMEYMAFGKPIVAFDLPEHRYSAGDAALYATDNDPAKLAEKIAQLIDDPALREQLGTIGKERIDTHLSWSQQEKELLRLYGSF
ncbi:MAG: glycosyltransferase family 4 protein [Chloroflexota bacterium]